MDQATQQNAALVEEMAAAASSLKGQAQELVSTLVMFKLKGDPAAHSGFAESAPAAKPVKRISAEPAPRPVNKALGQAAKPKTKLATTVPALNKPAPAPKQDDGDWTSF
jgi:methyl-accepting chemotaxis protein